MRIARVVAASSLAMVGVASATLGVSTNAEMAQHAQIVAIVRVTGTADNMLDGTVVTAFRGVTAGQKVHLPAIVGATGGDALVICDDKDMSCGADRDRGGYYIVSLPGRKAPVMLLPGLFVKEALPALVAGKPVPDLCMHVKVHFIDEPSADATLEGAFSPATGAGKLTGALVGATPLATTLVVGGPTRSSKVTVGLRSDTRGITFAGAPITRGADGCFAVTAIPELPLARTSKQLATILAGTASPVAIASGSVVVSAAIGSVPAGKTTIRIASFGSLSVEGPLFADGGIAELAEPDANGGLRVAFRAKADPTTRIWIDFGPLANPAASLDTRIAMLVTDGKPHDFAVRVELAGKPPVAAGKATVTHVAD